MLCNTHTRTHAHTHIHTYTHKISHAIYLVYVMFIRGDRQVF